MDINAVLAQLIFFIVSALTLTAGFLTVTVRNVFHAGLSLVGTFFGVAALYLMLEAEFLAIVQVLIYIGAIAVLILFAIMLTRSLMTNPDSDINKQWAWAGLAIVTLFLGMFLVILQVPWVINVTVITQDLLPALGTQLLTTYVLPFEIVSVLLLAALIGAFIIARE